MTSVSARRVGRNKITAPSFGLAMREGDAMHDPFFKSPVTVETTNAGDFRTLVSVAEAAIFLMERWPAEHGPRYRAALQACTSGLATAELVEDARRAFLAAAEEAGLRVKDEERHR
jgi:hypothetical protein